MTFIFEDPKEIEVEAKPLAAFENCSYGKYKVGRHEKTGRQRLDGFCIKMKTTAAPKNGNTKISCFFSKNAKKTKCEKRTYILNRGV